MKPGSDLAVANASGLKLFTPLTSNLDDSADDMLPRIYYILLSELLVTQFINYADMTGNFQRHVLAPRAMTQHEMNRLFVGTPYRLGERFTVSRCFMEGEEHAFLQGYSQNLLLI